MLESSYSFDRILRFDFDVLIGKVIYPISDHPPPPDSHATHVVSSWQWANQSVSSTADHTSYRLFHSLPLLSRFNTGKQITLSRDRSTKVWTTCERLLHSSAQPTVEPVTSRAQAWRRRYSLRQIEYIRTRQLVESTIGTYIFHRRCPALSTPGRLRRPVQFSVRSIAFTSVSDSRRNQPYRTGRARRRRPPRSACARRPATYVERPSKFHAAAPSNRHSVQSSDRHPPAPNEVRRKVDPDCRDTGDGVAPSTLVGTICMCRLVGTFPRTPTTLMRSTSRCSSVLPDSRQHACLCLYN